MRERKLGTEVHCQGALKQKKGVKQEVVKQGLGVYDTFETLFYQITFHPQSPIFNKRTTRVDTKILLSFVRRISYVSQDKEVLSLTKHSPILLYNVYVMCPA
jgi:hypothetical protein